MSRVVSFDSASLAVELERLSNEERDELGYGVIRLDSADTVTYYSRSEARQSGYRSRPALGRNFFLEVAPCMRTPELKGRIDEAQKAGDVDIEVGWVGDFNDPDREMKIRAVSASGGGLWLVLMREGAELSV